MHFSHGHSGVTSLSRLANNFCGSNPKRTIVLYVNGREVEYLTWGIEHQRERDRESRDNDIIGRIR